MKMSHWDRFLFGNFGILHTIMFPPLLYIHSCIIWRMENETIRSSNSTDKESHSNIKTAPHIKDNGWTAKSRGNPKKKLIN